MTRTYFLEEIDSWEKLLNFCWEYDCDICEDIISDSDLDSNISDDLREYYNTYSWTDIRDWMNDIDTSGFYYVRRGSFEYDVVDDDFDDYLEEVLGWADRNDIFEYEDDEDDEYEDDYNEEESGDEDEYEEEQQEFNDADFSIDELMSVCNDRFRTMEEERVKSEQEEENRVLEFICSC